MDRQDIIKIALDKLKLDGTIEKLASVVVESTLDLLEEKGMIDYSKYVKPKKETESKADAERIARLVECGFDNETINKILAKDNV